MLGLMTTEQPQSPRASSGAGGAQGDADPTASIQLRPASKKAAAAGVVRHFDWSGVEVRATGDISRGETGLAITRVEIKAPLPSGITHNWLRSVPLGEVLKIARADLVEHESMSSAPSEAQTVPAPVASGRTPITDDLLRKVAFAYIRETAPGKDRQATRRLAERFGRPEGTVRTWVSRARKEGWLAPGASGRMGAEPGPKLRGWVGRAVREYEPVEQEAFRIAEALGVKTAGQVMDALDAYDNETELDLAKKVGVRPVATCVAAEILWGQPLSAELAVRSSRAGATEETALEEIARELRQALADKGIPVSLGES